MKLSAQIDKSTAVIFKPNYGELLQNARKKIAEGFESDFPKIEKE